MNNSLSGINSKSYCDSPAACTLCFVQVTIKRIERNKRKHVTAIHGLEAFGASRISARPSLVIHVPAM